MKCRDLIARDRNVYNPSKDVGESPLRAEKHDSRLSTLVFSLYFRSRNLCEEIHWSVCYSEQSITGPSHYKERAHCGQ